MILPLRTLLLVLAVICRFSYASVIPKRDYENKNYFIFELNTTTSQKPLMDFIDNHGEFSFEHQLQGLENHYVFSIAKNHAHNEFLGNFRSNDHGLMKRSPGFEQHYDDLVNNLHLRSIHSLKPRKLSKRLPVMIKKEEQDFSNELSFKKKRLDIVDSSQQPVKDASEKLGINDPIFIEQWHLINTQYPGNDVNVTGLWYEGITGKGIVAAIVDDGLDAESQDLKDNFNAKGSWDFNDNTKLPLPRLFDDYHGTRCAGEIAAVKNDVCGVGVAYGSTVAGIRILSGAITAAEEAAGLIYGLDVNDIYSCSWGPTDDGRTLSEPEPVVKKAMIKGVQNGRKDKGSVYVFASGNGGRSDDSCNFDGYTNSIYSITVGAIDYKGLHPTYAEACSAVMVVTYSSGSGEHIHTTDIKGKCSASHGGTSAAAPLAAGIYSLVLQANPNLTWRDVQYVSVLSSSPINEDDGNYQITALNRKYSHKYGYGKMDAYKMAHFAKDWKNVKPQAWYYSDVSTVRDTITTNSDTEDSSYVIKRTITVTKEDLKVSNVERVEHVTVKLNILATIRGRVGVRLISPTGVISDLATFRPRDDSGKGFQNWTFMSVAHWGESGLGDWSIEVFGDDKGTASKNHIIFNDWQLRIFGESIDASKAETYDLDTDYAAVRRDRLGGGEQKPETTTSTSSSSTETSSSTISSSSTETSSSATSDDENKGNEIVSKSISATSSASSSASSSTVEPTEIDESSEPEDGKEKYTADRTGQYFMALAVVGFIVVIIFMRLHKTPGSGRRRRRREELQFDIIPGEDYSDTDEEELDSLDLGRRNDRRANSESVQNAEDVARDRLYDEFNGSTLPEYEEEMFRIDDEDDDRSKGVKQEDKKLLENDSPATETAQNENENEEDERLLGSSSRP
ncbi:peptidase S8/S53 domain-containing protein [Scheffersomyces xylosifermentans]|uniref:peptidase S8/S53 domain-containing protein n=1 Tax=Scheffersomyces xylosifermentans TaxID=1304137 RepID=UPI00315CED79